MSPADVVPEVLRQPGPDRIARARITDFATFVTGRTGLNLPDYRALWEYSTQQVADFWSALTDYFDVRWHSRPERAVGDAMMPGADWFPGGTLNYAEHALTGPDDGELAVINIQEDGTEQLITLGDLRGRVGAAQAGLARMGVRVGDRVVALVPNGMHALVGFLATSSLGAVWSSCSPDFGPGSVLDRFTQISPTVLIAVDGYRYGGKAFDVTETVGKLRAALPGLSGAVHIPVLGSPAPDGMTTWADLVSEPSEVQFTPVPFSAPLWVLYSSGTTGLPKPIVQSVGGILLETLKTAGLQADLGPGDRFFWYTTTGWMMWNYLVGGLLVGATILLYDGSPGYPDLMALWRLAERHRVSYFGTSAPFVASCRKAGLTPATELDLTSLRTIGSTGSPLGTDGFRWLHDEVGAGIQIASVSGGTDLCTAVVGAAPTVPVWMGEISCRALGAQVEAFSAAGDPLINEVGELVITAAMPSMPVYFWGDDGTRLHDAYFADYPGIWRHGDWIRITSRGSCVIEGRSDATADPQREDMRSAGETHPGRGGRGNSGVAGCAGRSRRIRRLHRRRARSGCGGGAPVTDVRVGSRRCPVVAVVGVAAVLILSGCATGTLATPGSTAAGGSAFSTVDRAPGTEPTLVVTVPELPLAAPSSAAAIPAATASVVAPPAVSSAADSPTEPATPEPTNSTEPAATAETAPAPATTANAPAPATTANAPAPAGDSLPVSLVNCDGCSVVATHRGVSADLAAALVTTPAGRAVLLSVASDGQVKGVIGVPYGASFPAPADGVLPCDSQARCAVQGTQPDGRAILSAFELTGTGAWRDVSGDDAFPSATERAGVVDLGGELGLAVQDQGEGAAVWMLYQWSGDRFTVAGCAPDGDALPSAAQVSPDLCLS